jgi:hypothetical protein
VIEKNTAESHVHVPEKLFVDTQLCIDAGKGTISASDWRRFAEFVNRDYSYCISPLTFVELAIGIARGPEQYFDRNRESVRALWSLSAARVVFSIPRYFVLRSVFGLQPPAEAHLENDFELCVRVILAARDKAQLAIGPVAVPGHEQGGYKFNLEKMIAEAETFMTAFSNAFNFARGSRSVRVTKASWIDTCIRFLGVADTDENRAKFENALDAEFVLESEFDRLRRSGNYDFCRHRSDLMDCQQLLYLCDPTVNLVTGDEKLRNRTISSSQACRIHLFEELLHST